MSLLASRMPLTRGGCAIQRRPASLRAAPRILRGLHQAGPPPCHAFLQAPRLRSDPASVFIPVAQRGLAQ